MKKGAEILFGPQIKEARANLEKLKLESERQFEKFLDILRRVLPDASEEDLAELAAQMVATTGMMAYYSKAKEDLDRINKELS